MTLLLDDEGREITIAGADSVIPGATNAAWLADGISVVYLTELAQAAAQGPAVAATRSPSNQSPANPAPSNQSPSNRDSSNPKAKPPINKLFTMNRVKPFAEGASALFHGHLFSAVAWNMKQNGGVAIEREASATGVPRLVTVDLARETSRVLGSLEGYT